MEENKGGTTIIRSHLAGQEKRRKSIKWNQIPIDYNGGSYQSYRKIMTGGIEARKEVKLK